MGQLSVLPVPSAIDAAWERYSRLAAALGENHSLAADRAHMEEMARAEMAWKRAYQAWEGS